MFFTIANSKTDIPNGKGKFQQAKDSYVHKGWIVYRGFGMEEQVGIYTVKAQPHQNIEVVADKNTQIPESTNKFFFFGAPDQADKNFYAGYNAPARDAKKIAFFGADQSNATVGIYLAKKYDQSTGVPYTLKLVANTSTQIPGGIGNFTKFNAPYLNEGHVSFHAYGKDNQEGIYFRQKDKSENHTLHVIVDINTDIPEGTGKFTQIWNPSFDGGFVAFRGRGINEQEGMFITGFNKPLKIIVKKSDYLPNGTSRIKSIGGPSLQGGKIAFRITTDKDENAILFYDGNQLNTLVDHQTQIPAGEGTFTHFFNPTQDNGNVIFVGGKAKASSNPDKPEFEQYGIYIYMKDTVQKVIDFTDKVEDKKIKNLDLGPVGLSETTVGIHVTFEDGTEGLYGINDITKYCDEHQKSNLNL